LSQSTTTSNWGPTGFVRRYSAQQRAAFRKNRLKIHNHSWLGGEVLNVTDMGPDERDYYDREWYCQFCGALCQGESLDHASKTIIGFVPLK
jgi:hypothetical protein